MKHLAIFLLCGLIHVGQALGQAPAHPRTMTDDLTHFWQAYDRICSTTDSGTQLRYIRNLYIDKASPGLQAFMRNKEHLEQSWVDLIRHNRAFWDSLRPKMALVQRTLPLLQTNLARYQQLYASLSPADFFFLIGIGQQGGTTRNNAVLIGTEVVVAEQKPTVDKLLLLCLHEYTHTQQKRPDFRQINVLTSSIREGACDFMAELVSGKTIIAPYRTYGLAHEASVWAAFKQAMYTRDNDRWVSTGDNPTLPAPDLGYFVGYQICAAYYARASDKRQAVRDILQLDYADSHAVTRFLQESGYNPVGQPGQR